MHIFLRYLIITGLMTSVLSACSGGGSSNEPPTTGTLAIMVTDRDTGDALMDSRVIIYLADTNEPYGNALTTDTNGNASSELAPDTYYIKVAKQGYEPSPANNVTPLPFVIALGTTTTSDVSLKPLEDSTLGSISGDVSDGTDSVASVLVTATNANDTLGYSSVTDASGNYVIFNLPVDTYTVKAWVSGYNSDEQTIAVVQNTDSSDVALILTAGTTGSVIGQVTFLATENTEVDVSLVHPLTKETIPGLATMTTSQQYTLNDVPQGTYLARASFENDGIVIDPDWIVKFGEPTISVSDTEATRDFSVTNAITLINPTNPIDDTNPIVIDTLTPTFTWKPYSSSSDYVIEVIDNSGIVMWGGFTGDYETRNIIIPDDQNSDGEIEIVYNADGNAGALQDGEIYRWRIYASKDNRSDDSWNLISTSEDQQGLFKVELPTAQ